MTTNFSQGKYVYLMEQQKILLEKAYRRQGERPTDGRTQSQLVQDQMRAWNYVKQKKPTGFDFVLDSSIIAPYYAPSTASVRRLKKISPKDLQLETHHRGFYLMLEASLLPVNLAGAVIALMRDEAQTMVMTTHYYEDAKNLSLGGLFIIKEPYFTITSEGHYCVRVDHVTDIIRLVPGKDDSYISRKLLAPPGFKEEGNKMMGAGMYADAAVTYSSALKKNATTDEIQTLQLNRALAHLKMHSYEAALDDVKSMVLKDHPPEKAAYRASQAHYHLNQFQLCLHTLEKLLRHYPENEAAIREKARVQGRILEQSTGKYDFQKMCNDSKTRPLSLDNATYVGSVKVKQSEGRGQGLFTTKNVVAGELLLCEKAFAYCYEEGQEVQPDDFTKNPVLANVLTSRVMIGTQVRLMKEIIQKLKRNPSLIPSVTSLHHGSYVPVEDQVENDPFPQKVIDTFLIYHIISLNTFGCPITSQACHANGHALPPEQVERQHSSAGLWLIASRINHSCVSNVQRSFIGDMQIIRAACDMPADTEIMFMYHAAKQDGSDGSAASTTLAQYTLRHWGFECTCAICTYDKITPSETLSYRDGLLDELESSFRDFSRDRLPVSEEILTALETAYFMPAVQVPRLAIWQPYFFVLRQYDSQNNPAKSISTGIKLLTALGFVITGLPVTATKQSPKSEVKFHVKKWGLMFDHIIEVFLRIWKACKKIHPNHCKSVEAVARTAYMICVGEDHTFWETYGKFYGMEKP